MMKKADMVAAILQYEVNTFTKDQLNALPAKELKGILTTCQVAQGAPAEEVKTTEEIPEQPKEQEKAQESKKETRSKAKDEVLNRVLNWLEAFRAETEGNGHVVIVKSWEKIPTLRSLKVDGVTYFEICHSANGIRLNAKSELIPENLRPAGANIIKNGLDLTIPTFTDIEAGLTKYAEACRCSLSAKAEAKAAKEKEKAEAKAAAKAAKQAAKAAKQEQTKKAEEQKEEGR